MSALTAQSADTLVRALLQPPTTYGEHQRLASASGIGFEPSGPTFVTTNLGTAISLGVAIDKVIDERMIKMRAMTRVVIRDVTITYWANRNTWIIESRPTQTFTMFTDAVPTLAQLTGDNID